MQRRPVSNSSIRALSYLALLLSAFVPWGLAAGPDVAASAAIDPDKAPSEMNHHIAGIFLLAIGLSVIGSARHRSLAWLRWLPPALFVMAGLFLAAWSDDEIWPRGNLSWSWLLLHDAEARQHKLYALLLIVLGIVEGIQAIPKLRRPWLTAVFPLLCVIGGTSLLFHRHSGSVSANTVTPSAPASAMAPHHSHHNQFGAGPLASAPEHEHGAASGDPSSAPANLVKANATWAADEQLHNHGMNGVEARIQREHLWFAVVGFLVALFKFLYDSARPPARLRKYLWANSVIVLGSLLLIYSE